MALWGTRVSIVELSSCVPGVDNATSGPYVKNSWVSANQPTSCGGVGGGREVTTLAGHVLVKAMEGVWEWGPDPWGEQDKGELVAGLV